MIRVTHLAHAAFKAADLEASVHFYRDILGLREKFHLPLGDLLKTNVITEESVSAMPDSPEKSDAERLLRFVMEKPDKPWITYFEIAPHEYLEIFSPEGGEEVITFDLAHFDHVGYLHIALEVDDIHQTYEEICRHDVRILTEPKLGPDDTWQFWITDPDGNAIEFMEYTDKSLQLQ